VQAFYRLGDERHEEIGYRDELRMLDINFRLLAQNASRYFQPSSGSVFNLDRIENVEPG
jgi:hypothetical protein